MCMYMCRDTRTIRHSPDMNDCIHTVKICEIVLKLVLLNGLKFQQAMWSLGAQHKKPDQPHEDKNVGTQKRPLAYQ